MSTSPTELLTHLSPSLLSTLAASSDHAPLHKLRLSHHAFTTDLSLLTSLPLSLTLLKLDLSFNKLTHDLQLTNLSTLLTLNLSNNSIPTLDKLGLPRTLTSLSVANNMLPTPETITPYILSSLPSLTTLDVSNNPTTSTPSLYKTVVTSLAHMTTIDGLDPIDLLTSIANVEGMGMDGWSVSASQSFDVEYSDESAFDISQSAEVSQSVEALSPPLSPMRDTSRLAVVKALGSPEAQMHELTSSDSNGDGDLSEGGDAPVPMASPIGLRLLEERADEVCNVGEDEAQESVVRPQTPELPESLPEPPSHPPSTVACGVGTEPSNPVDGCVQTEQTEGVPVETQTPPLPPPPAPTPPPSSGPDQSSQIAALTELLTSFEKRSDRDAEASAVWRDIAYKNTLLKNVAVQQGAVAVSSKNAALTESERVKKECGERVVVEKGKRGEAEALVETSMRKRRIAEQISSDCRSQTKLMDTTLRNLASWCSSFVEGQSPPLPSSSSKYQQRGASIVASFAPRAPPHVPAPSPSRARELALKTGCELLERYQSRLSSMESNLRVLSLSLAAKDARLRNEVALLAAQKSALPAQQDIWSPSPLTIALPPNVEAVLRAAFKRLEKTETPGGVGKVSFTSLLALLNSDPRLARCVEIASPTSTLAASLIDRIKTVQAKLPSTNLTWGEFLLCFVDGGLEQLIKYEAAGIPSPSHTAIKFGEEAYNHATLKQGASPHRNFEVAHLELTLPIDALAVIEREGDLRALERMEKGELIRTVRRITAERQWCMDVLHRVCCQGPRANILELASKKISGGTEQLMLSKNSLEKELNILQIEGERDKTELKKCRRALEVASLKSRRMEERHTEEREKGLEEKVIVLEQRLDVYKQRLDKSEEELGESRRCESSARKDCAKGAARVQAAVREVARGEKRLIAAVNGSKKIENECMQMIRAKEAENKELREKLRASEENAKLLLARSDGLLQGREMVLEVFDRMGEEKETNGSPTRSVRSVRSFRSPPKRAPEPEPVEEKAIVEEKESLLEPLETSDMEEMAQGSTSGLTSLTSRDKFALFDRLNNITALTNDILEDSD